MYKLINLPFFVCLLFSKSLLPQEVVNSAGGNGLTVSYPVGQIAQSIFQREKETIIHGVQQPFEISVATAASVKPSSNIIREKL